MIEPVVNIETIEFKSSIKRNAVGSFILVSAIIGIVTFLTFKSMITLLTAFYIMSFCALLGSIITYYTMYSILIDCSIYAMRKRGDEL